MLTKDKHVKAVEPPQYGHEGALLSANIGDVETALR